MEIPEIRLENGRLIYIELNEKNLCKLEFIILCGFSNASKSQQKFFGFFVIF